MKLELQSAANFLVHLIRLGRRNISENQLDDFREAVVDTLRRRYRDHWFPEKPFKGSGYRCIRINGHMDPVVAQAAESCGLSAATIHKTFPSELTMWVDPLEVSYRIGENGSICVLYEYKENTSNNQAAWQPSIQQHSSSSSSKSRSTTPTDNVVVSKKVESSSSVPSSPSHRSNPKSSTTTPTTNNINSVVYNNKHNQQQQQHYMNNLNHKQHLLSSNSSSPSSTAVFPTTKHLSSPADSLYKLDCLLDPRKSVSIEQLAAYVS